MNTPDDFSRIMYHLVIGAGWKPGTPTVKRIAGWLNIKEVTVYKKLEGELSFTVEEFIAIYRNSRKCDSRRCAFHSSLDYVVHECDAELVLSTIERDGDIDGSFADERDDISIKVGELTEHLNRAICDIDVDAREKHEALRMLDYLTGVIGRYKREVAKYGEK